MNGRDVLEVLHRLRAVGAHAWVDGGWGIDGLPSAVGRVHTTTWTAPLPPG